MNSVSTEFSIINNISIMESNKIVHKLLELTISINSKKAYAVKFLVNPENVSIVVSSPLADIPEETLDEFSASIDDTNSLNNCLEYLKEYEDQPTEEA